MRVPPEKLVGWEAGIESPTIPQLRKITHSYGRSLPVFYMETPPTDWPIPRDLRRLPGEAPITMSPELIIGMRVAQFRRAVLLGLEADTEPSDLVGIAGGMEADELAGRVREILGVSLERQQSWAAGHDSLNGWKNALEVHGVLVFHFTSVSVIDVRGYSISDPILPIIGLNGHDSVNGQIFTLAHELGHLAIGTGSNCDLGDATVPRASRPTVEVYCNRFAGAMLVPGTALLGDPVVRLANRGSEWDAGELERLAARFRVSREVALRRLLSLEKASAEFYRQHRAQMIALPPPEAREPDPDSKGPAFATMVVRDVGKPFARAVVAAYRADEISGPDLTDFLGAGVHHLPAIEGETRRPRRAHRRRSMTVVYCLDSSALINPWNKHYSIDLTPGYWSSIRAMSLTGAVVISEEVRDEVYAQRDGLTDWVKENIEQWYPLTDEVQSSLRAVMKDWSRMVRNGKRNRADPVVIATALAAGATVVTEEGPGKATAPGIPRVCASMNVTWMTTYDFVRAAGIQLV